MSEHEPAGPAAAPRGPTWDDVISRAPQPSVPGAPPAGRDRAFTAGRLITATYSTWARHLLRFTAIGLAGAIPSAVASYLALRDMTPPVVDRAHPFAGLTRGWGDTLLVMAVGFLVSPPVTAATIQVTTRHLREEPVASGELLSTGFRRYFPLLGTSLLATLAMWATLCLVAPPFVLGAGWCAALPVAALEGRSPVGALGRSWALTRGARWRALLGILAVMLPMLAVASALPFFLREALSGPTRTYGEVMATTQAVVSLVAAVTAPLLTIAMAVAYHQLREGDDRLARVFE
jgi:hypothetical protein